MFKKSLLALAIMTGIAGCNVSITTEDDKDHDKDPHEPMMELEVSGSLVARAVLNTESPEGAAEIVAFHYRTSHIYAVNSSGDSPSVEIIDASDIDANELEFVDGVSNDTNLSIAASIDLTANTDGDANSIAIDNNNELLAVAIAADGDNTNGSIAFYDISGDTPVFLKNVEAGVLPDMVAFSPDGTKAVAANEGEPAGDYLVDAEGSVTIIDIVDGMPEDVGVQLDLNQFNDQKEDLEAEGVRFAHPVAGAITIGEISNVESSVAQDLEPEYVSISPDSSTAFVSVQENNAILIIDLEDEAIVDLAGLGFKDWGMYELDASDKDDAVNFRSYDNLYGMFQPDTIDSFEVDGELYVITANEGDGREYFFDVADETACDNAIDADLANDVDYDEDDGCLSYIDESRVEDLVLDADAFPDVMNDDSDIGRLKVSVEYGDTDGDGDYDELYTYGARSFSIFDEDGQLVWDSGDDVGKITNQIHGDLFNNDEDVNEGDTRSDAKGAEPESVTVGEINDHLFAFVGLERMGGIMIYDISEPTDPEFVEYLFNRDLTEGLEIPAIAGDLAPEGMKFIHADNSPTGEALLVVGNEISGSVAVWEINADYVKMDDE